MFQSPEGDSLFFYKPRNAEGMITEGAGFSPPKGIHCFSTSYRLRYFVRDYNRFQSPEGDSLFFYVEASQTEAEVEANGAGFQSPEGDSLFFYLRPAAAPTVIEKVSVPRRGFIVFLLDSSGHVTVTLPVTVSVPRRGFIVFLQGCGCATGSYR